MELQDLVPVCWGVTQSLRQQCRGVFLLSASFLAFCQLTLSQYKAETLVPKNALPFPIFCTIQGIGVSGNWDVWDPLVLVSKLHLQEAQWDDEGGRGNHRP